jgi:hypothetical protein
MGTVDKVSFAYRLWMWDILARSIERIMEMIAILSEN